MGRCTVTRWAFVAGLLCYCGCTGPQTFSPFGWMRGNDAAQTSSKADKNNPLKPADQVASDDASASKADGDAAADLKAPDKPGKNGFKAAGIDPELRKQMEAELAYESPDERKRLYDQWSKFDPGFIHDLIDSHRMARETAENREQPVKLASGDGPANQTAQAPEMDPQPAPNRSTAAAAPSEPTVRNQSPPPASQAAGNPWSESSDMPPVSTAPVPPASTAPAAPGNGPNNVAAAAGPSAPDAFDALNGPGQPAKPISVVPQPPTRPAGNATSVSPGASTPAPRASTPSNADAFSSMAPLDDAAAPASLPAARPASASATPPATLSTPVPDSAAKSSDGLLIHPGVAAPASVISNLQTQAKGANTGSAATDFDSAAAAPSIDAPAPVRPPGQPATSAAVADTTQPVQLQPPIDLPTSPATPSSPAETKAPVTPASATAASSPSALAGLGNRLMGAITPSLGAAVRTAAQSGSWHDELQKIVNFAASEAGQTSVGTTDTEKLKYVEKQVHLRMLYLLSGQPAKSLEPISGLDAADQEFWQQVFWGLSNYFDKTAMADPSDRATQTIAQLRTAVQRLKEKSKLELRNVAFCQKISSYGNYERVKRDEFTPGQSVLLYAEVENFKSEATTEGPYRTMLKSTIEIFDSQGGMVVRMPFQAPDDLCASQRRDYYNTYEFAIPQRIGMGPHTLKLTVEDQISHKVATYTVNFTVK
jgi:hypothetical protein